MDPRDDFSMRRQLNRLSQCDVDMAVDERSRRLPIAMMVNVKSSMTKVDYSLVCDEPVCTDDEWCK